MLNVYLSTVDNKKKITITLFFFKAEFKQTIYLTFTYQISDIRGLEQTMAMSSGSQNPWPAADPRKLQSCHELRIKPLSIITTLNYYFLGLKYDTREREMRLIMQV